MNDKKGAELIFLPLYGKWLGVAMKVVTSDKQKHFGLSGSPTSDLSTDCEAIVTYQQPFKNPNRIAVHFLRKSRYNTCNENCGGDSCQKNSLLPLPRVAAARMSEKKPFGFSLQDCDKSDDGKQQFLQLAYFAKDLGKPEGFEDLYLKMVLPPEAGYLKPVYLRITLTKRVINSESGFMVRAVEVSEKMAPAHLQKIYLKSEIEMIQD